MDDSNYDAEEVQKIAEYIFYQLKDMDNDFAAINFIKSEMLHAIGNKSFLKEKNGKELTEKKMFINYVKDRPGYEWIQEYPYKIQAIVIELIFFFGLNKFGRQNITLLHGFSRKDRRKILNSINFHRKHWHGFSWRIREIIEEIKNFRNI